MLEKDDYSSRGEYLPKLSGRKELGVDYFVLVRINNNLESIAKRNRFYYSDSIEYSTLAKIIFDFNWNFDIPGYITLADLIFVISQNQILNKGMLLNDSVKMDALNYYIQAGDLRAINSLISELQSLMNE